MSKKEHKIDEELKTTQVKTRTSESEKKKIKKLAGDLGLSDSEYIRNRALGYKIHSKVDTVAVGQMIKMMGLLKNLHNERIANNISLPELERESLKTLNLINQEVRKILKEADNDS